MNRDQTVQIFVDHFRERGHRLVTGSSLIPPPGDPVLFTTSGMHPLTPYLGGRPHPLGRRLVNVQRCLRTTDLDEVGDDTHLTVFEMLGSWSLGDYDLSQSLRWGYELMVDGYGVDPGRLHVTVDEGDDESTGVWRDLGLPVERTADENWWSNGPTGLCGPDSEIFVWSGVTPPSGTPTTDPRWVEVWNHVSMRYHRHDDGTLEPLRQPNVDTGLGLERLLTVLQGVDSVYDTDTLRPWTAAVSTRWPLDRREHRVVCDHLRATGFVVEDGVRPSNTGRGYVLRRLIRRVLTILWRGDPSRTLSDLPGWMVPDIVVEEERRFRTIVDKGRSIVARRVGRGPLTDDDYVWLHETHGLPRDLVALLFVHR